MELITSCMHEKGFVHGKKKIEVDQRKRMYIKLKSNPHANNS